MKGFPPGHIYSVLYSSINLTGEIGFLEVLELPCDKGDAGVLLPFSKAWTIMPNHGPILPNPRAKWHCMTAML